MVTTRGALEAGSPRRIATALAAQKEYVAASDAAIARATSGGDPYEAQQAAAGLTKGKDRPIATALNDLADRLSARAQANGQAIQADVVAMVPYVIGGLVLALLAGLAIALGLARSIVSAVQSVARAQGLVGRFRLAQAQTSNVIPLRRAA